MRHGRRLRKLGRSPAHRARLFQHLAEGLFRTFIIQTTIEKAKEARPQVEHLITLARKGTPQCQRLIQKVVRDKLAYKTLLEKIGPACADRAGGYTRILRVGQRPGDGAQVVVFELVDREKLGAAPGRFLKAGKAAKEKEAAAAAKK